ncbi:MFS general substrate transporter [Trametes versicolor FP-101664 SS1]|uniref:MFS general substrate transporter n=1 Tax=Trametes versicolor (strain FP-101664) TaxID=717944 RepID=UPI0004621935|nr:MFS general substrate transporter [Trametes versicolor FP-101664 SS1]EIW56752.1 MFS general substrate transporter [Trametes versicolor FP-101664 SS1]
MSEKCSSPSDLEGKHQKDGTITPVSRVTTVTSTDLFEDGTVDPVYQAKARVLNAAIQEIGMGKYQWGLFAVAGFGWFADSVWPLLGGLILSPVVNEFHFNGPFLSLALNIGLFVGAVFWGLGCDVWGRRWSFNITLFLAGVFGLAAGGSPDFITLASLLAVLGLGVGGNLPVDSAVFLDFVPGSHQYLLTILSIWWSVGQLVASFIAWPLIANFSCPQGSTTCTRGENMGWRYLLFTLGGMTIILWAIRLFVFPLYESPRFLVGIGRDAEAVEVVHRIAAYNGRTSNLSLLDLQAAAVAVGGQKSEGETKLLSRSSVFTMDHIKGLFATPKLAWSTSLLIFLWGIIGLASTLYNSFLPFLLASRGAQFGDSSYFTTYRNQVILGVIGVPGAFLAGWAVEQPYVGRKGTLALSAGLTGVFLFASTTARSSNALLGWNCGYAFCSNIMYGVLYALSPEVFPAKDRGTGNGLTATATRVFGIIAPVIALYANLETAVPVYVSGALIIGAGFLALLLPYEPRGKASI